VSVTSSTGTTASAPSDSGAEHAVDQLGGHDRTRGVMHQHGCSAAVDDSFQPGND